MLHDDDLYRFVWMTRPLLRSIEAAVERTLEGSGLTVRMRAVLEVLYAEGAMAVPSLARALQIERQYVQLMVNETLEAGLTAREANPAHKRSPLINLTPKGRELLEKVRAAEARNLKTISSEIAGDDVAAARRVQEHLIEAFDRIARGVDE